MAYKRHKRPPIAQINVVPYIDVMLVLLIVFMITSPLLTQGVKVDLPQANANPVTTEQTIPPLIITIDKQGAFYIDKQQLTQASLLQRVTAVVNSQAKTEVLIRGDNQVAYGNVVAIMSLLQQAGISSVGLITETPKG